MKSSTELYRLYDKTKKIILSCETTDQLDNSINFINLFSKHFQEPFSMSDTWNTRNDQVREMYNELMNIKNEKFWEII